MPYLARWILYLTMKLTFMSRYKVISKYYETCTVVQPTVRVTINERMIGLFVNIIIIQSQCSHPFKVKFVFYALKVSWMSVKKIIVIFVSYVLDFEKMSAKKYFEQHCPNDRIHTRYTLWVLGFPKCLGLVICEMWAIHTKLR